MSALGGVIMPRPLKQVRRVTYAVTNPVGALGGAVEDLVVDALRPRPIVRTTSSRGGLRSAPSRGWEQRVAEIEQSMLENAALEGILRMHIGAHPTAARQVALPAEPVDHAALQKKRQSESVRGIRFWHRTERRAARSRAAAVADEEARAEEERRRDEVVRNQAMLDEEWQKLLRHEVEAVYAALERAFEDVSYPILARARTKSGVIMFVGFPGIDVIPASEPAETRTGRPTLKKRSKTVRNELYAEALAAFALSNVRRALAAAPAARNATIVVLRPLENAVGFEPVASVCVDRELAKTWSSGSSALLIFEQLGGEVVRRGRTSEVMGTILEFDPQLQEIAAMFRRGDQGIRAIESLENDPNVSVTFVNK